MKKFYFPVIEQNEIDFVMERRSEAAFKAFFHGKFVADLSEIFSMAKSKMKVDLRLDVGKNLLLRVFWLY